MDKRTTTIVQIQRRRGQKPAGSTKKALPLLFLVGLLSMFLLMLTPVVAGAAVAAGVYMYFAQDLPEPGQLHSDAAAFKTTKIYGRPVLNPTSGKTEAPLLYEIFDPQGGKRTLVPIDVLKKQKWVIAATIPIENRSFYTDPGIDIRGFARGLYLTATHQDVQGGSTITQQLIKNVLLTQEFTIDRKAKEMILALEISRRYSKDQILEMYLNEIPYGNLAYGIEAAAQSYFGKTAADLSLAESAMLAALAALSSANSPTTIRPKPSASKSLSSTRWCSRAMSAPSRAGTPSRSACR